MRGINIHTTQLMEKTNERYSIRKYKVFNKTKQKIIKNLIQNIQIYQKNIKFNWVFLSIINWKTIIFSDYYNNDNLYLFLNVKMQIRVPNKLM